MHAHSYDLERTCVQRKANKLWKKIGKRLIMPTCAEEDRNEWRCMEYENSSSERIRAWQVFEGENFLLHKRTSTAVFLDNR